MTNKTSRQLERHFKGVSNHWRIEVLLLLQKENNMSLEDIIERLGGGSENIGEHVRKLSRAGLVNKNYEGRMVMHSLTPYGKKFARFIENL